MPLARVQTKAKTLQIMDSLARMYPDAKCALEHDNAFELLIATMLSAQCTDVRVNIITRRLFAKYKRPEDYLALTQEQLEDEIRDCGLFRNKAKNIREMCKQLLDHHGGEVPAGMDALTALPGVGRKTANVVLSNAFGVPAIAVDTHVFRVSHRLGLAGDDAKTPEQVEEQLMRRIPRELWSQAHHWLIHHGRNLCDARTPQCAACDLAAVCPAAAGIVREREKKTAARAAKTAQAARAQIKLAPGAVLDPAAEQS